MRHLRRIASIIRNLISRSRVDRDLDAEMSSYADLVADERRSAGRDPSVAGSARLAFGNLEAAREAVWQDRAGASIDRLRQDLRSAAAGLRRAPAFAALTIGLLAVGIGSVATMFSVADAALFKPLPYDRPEELVDIAEVLRAGTPEETHSVGVTWTELDRWRAEREIFSSVGTYSNAQRVVLSGLAVSGDTYVGRVSPELLVMLGVRPRLGRWFTPGDVAQRVLLISDGFWHTQFGADPAVVGRTLTMNGVSHTIIGVMPPTFSAVVGYGLAMGWLPFDEAAERRSPGSTSAETVFRLRDGLPRLAAEREAQAAAARAAGPSAPAPTIELLPVDSREWLRTNVQLAVPVLLGVVGLVLLIACANVASLVLARALGRRRELAVRASLGASRGRLIRQMVTEGFALAAIGGCAGVALASLAAAKLPDLLPPQLSLFAANPMAIDARVLLVSAAAVVLTTIVSSVVPAIRASGADVTGVLESGPRAVASVPGQRLRRWLQVVEVALTLVLLSATSLLASSFIRMLSVPPGYAVDNLAVASLGLPSARYPSPAAQHEFFERLMAAVRLMPAVRAASFGPPPPSGMGGRFIPEGREHDASLIVPTVSLYWVDANYFSTTGIPLEQGRPFNPADTGTSAPVALVDAATANRFWPHESAIGHRFRYSPYGPWITIVGVVGPVKTKEFTSRRGTAEAYFPQAQSGSQAFRTLVIRVDRGDPLVVVGTIQPVVHALDPKVDLQRPSRVDDLYDDVLVEPRFYVSLMSVFAGIAAVTAGVGLFGLLNYAVGQRVREIAVRLALGATRRDIRALVLRDAIMPVASGLAIGGACSLWLTRALRSLIFGITTHDPASFAASAGSLIGIAVIATLLPARRAVRVDPVQTLRVE